MNFFIRKHIIFIKYALVGCLGTAIDLGSLYIFVDFLHLNVLLGTAISFVLAVINNFTLNKYWTFENKSSNIRKQFIKFLTVSIMGLILTEIFMALFVYGIHIWYIASKIVTSGLVLTWNFVANKYWTFRDRVYSVLFKERFEYDVSVIVPVFNEQKRIGKTLVAIDNYFSDKQITRQIVVVNDGSDDDTAGVVEKLKKKINNLQIITYQPNRGKGYAVKKGIENSLGAYILFTDADNSTPIEEFEKFYPLLREYKVVIGSRYLEGSNIVIKQPLYRVIIGRIANALIQFTLLDDIKDTQCGFKAFQHATANDIMLRMKINRFGFDIEMLSIARLLNYPVKEVPVCWYNSSESRIRPIKDSFKTLVELLQIKLNLWGGRYS